MVVGDGWGKEKAHEKKVSVSGTGASVKKFPENSVPTSTMLGYNGSPLSPHR